VLVDQTTWPSLHDVLHVLVEHDVGAQRGVHVVQEREVGRGVEAVALSSRPSREHVLDELVSELRELDLALLLVDGEVAFLLLVRRARGCGTRC
jgi:hypothetical protein